MESARKLAFIIIVLWCVCKISCYLWTSEINLPQGTLKGIINWTSGYKAFLGVPYASVVKRFQVAGPAPQWEGILYASQGSIKCKQYFTLLKRPVGQEDCLVANIFTPLNMHDNLLPVMVFIHGGGYHSGSNTDLLYNPKYLVQKGMIVITINYRIGAFGFLCLRGTKASGNVGLKDQITALHWIRDNVIAFRGNPDEITVLGESAGAASIHYIIASGKYKGLFDRAILQSGSMLMPNKIDHDPIKSAAFVASRLGFQTGDPAQLLMIFENATANDIIEASHVDPKNQPLKTYIFRPCVEYPKDDEESIITANPRALIESVTADPELKVILGYNDKEGIMWAGKYDLGGLGNLNKEFSNIIPGNLQFTDEANKAAFANHVQKFYFGKNGKQSITYDSLIDFFSDAMIVYPSIASTFSLLSRNITVYNYFFKYDSVRNLNKFVSGLPKQHGANHADELFYIFDPMIYNILLPKENDLRIIDTLTTLWTNFAKSGHPTIVMKDIQWIQSNKDDLKFLQIDNEIKMIPLPNAERFFFWSSVYTKYTSY